MADDSASPSGPEDVVAGPEDVVAGPEDVVAGPEDVVAGPSKRIKLSESALTAPTCDLNLCGLPVPTDITDGSISVDSSRCVLHVIVDDMTYPVSLDMLTQVFSLHGTVSKIVTFNHNETFHALIQYADGASAHEGKLKLNGQNVFTGCCKLYIEYSKLQDLVVKYNSDISRDYTNADLVWNDSPSFSTATVHNKTAASLAEPKKGLLPIPRTAYPPLELRHPTTALPSKFLAPSTSVMQVTNPFYAAPPSSVALPKEEPGSGRGPVILVSNLDESRVSLDSLFTLFGVYGDVIRVKICCNTKSKALIQYKDYKYARDAKENLHGVRVGGKAMKVSFSKHAFIFMPEPGFKGADLTHDYSTSRWHRFRNEDRALLPVVPPSKTLFLANIPPDVTTDYLKTLFSGSGSVTDFKFFEPSNLYLLQQALKISRLPPNSDAEKTKILSAVPERRMGLIQMSSVEEAVESLVTLHNKQFPGTNRYLCVSFTQSIIQHHDQGGADQ